MHWGVHIRRRNHGDTLTHRRVCQDLNREACKSRSEKLHIDILEHREISLNSPSDLMSSCAQSKDALRVAAALEDVRVRDREIA